MRLLPEGGAATGYEARIESVVEVNAEPESGSGAGLGAETVPDPGSELEPGVEHPRPHSRLPDDVPREGLGIGEAARRTGVSVHTLRYYERVGLVVTPVDRTHSGRRRYHRLDLEWITVCTRLRATGMPIRGIRRYAELVAEGRGNEADRLDLLASHRAEVVAGIAELQENLRLIDHKIDVYRGRLADGDADRLWAPHRSPDAR
ncbi:MerR family transcriptional regulator [Streptomyces sp. NPDC046203]|uniref:MerR family transcriptional regulator n=1 Tax=Streptomyces sp. NPDC046203 TaxID=3154602 RepID=UPI0033FAB35E